MQAAKRNKERIVQYTEEELAKLPRLTREDVAHLTAEELGLSEDDRRRLDELWRKAEEAGPGSAEEEAAINAGIALDPDAAPEWSEEEWRQARPAREVLVEQFGPEVAADMLKRKPGQRGRQRTPTKESITLRLDRDVLAHFRASGAGWQSRINEALRRAMGK